MLGEMEKLADTLTKEGKKPYIISGGASNAIGATGYVACAKEIQQQLFNTGLTIDHMVVPSGSAGTHAGIAVGMYGTNAGIPILGINVSRKKELQEGIVHKLAVETAKHVSMREEMQADQITCFDEYVGPGYSIPTGSMIEAVKLLAQTESILLDPVYSGKAMAGMVDLVRNGHFAEGSNVLFLHTGGSPALYAYLDTFK